MIMYVVIWNSFEMKLVLEIFNLKLYFMSIIKDLRYKKGMQIIYVSKTHQ